MKYEDNFDLFNNHVADSPSCSHCEGINEDAFHYMFYTIPRATFHDEIINIGPFTLRTILYGLKGSASNNKIHEAISKYIDSTKHFDNQNI